MNRKVNASFLLVYILVAIIIFIIPIAIMVTFGMSNDWVVIPLILFSLIFVLWLVLVPIIAPSIFRKSAYKKLEKFGFKIEREYKNLTYTLLIDITGGRVAKIYSFNPSNPYIMDSGRIQKIWVDEMRNSINDVGIVSVKFVVNNNIEYHILYNQTVGKGKRVYLPQNHPRIISARQEAHKIACELNDSWKFARSKYRR